MVRESSKNRSIRLTDTVMHKLNLILEKDDIRSINSLMEILISSYEENKSTAFKSSKKDSDTIKKDINIMKKEIATLLYLNGNIGEFLSLSEINDIDSNTLIIQSRDKVKRDIESNQVKRSFENKN